jgi:hypothetical protein
MEAANRRAFRLRACQTCGGDAYVDLTDGAEWRCLQCGRLVSDQPVGVLSPHVTDVPKAA